MTTSVHPGIAQLPAACQAFVEALGDVFEHAPWVAEPRFPAGPIPTVAALHEAMMARSVREPGRAAAGLHRRAIRNSASKVAARSTSPTDSQDEQGCLGLDRLSDAEFDTFSR